MVSSHSNKVKIKNSAIESIEYIDNSLVITGGQPSSPPPNINKSGDTWTVDMECGRKGNSSVASQFVATCGGVGHVFSPSAINDSSPDKLNFFFGIRVGFQLDGEMFYVELYVGQGHRATRNNWWIGGKFIASHSESVQSAVINIPTIPSGEVKEVYSITGGISDFSLTPWIQMGSVPEQPSWLKRVPDNNLICDINLPGTHDSAAINRLIHTPYACHNHTLSEQLLYGVRLIDIRLSVHEENGNFSFITCHGDIGLNEYQNFPSALDECNVFLTSNPSEFIAMSLKVDDWNNITNKTGAYSALLSLLNQYPIFTSSNMPTLGDVRSKIYLLNRMNNDIGLGVPIGWEDNTPGSWAPSESNRNFKLYVQDKYDKSAEAEKYQLFTDAIPMTSPGEMLFNFASGVQKLVMGVYIMDLLLEYFGNKNATDRPTRLGWMLFDYIFTNYSTNTYGDINILQLIIASNFRYAGYENKFIVDKGHHEL